MSDVIRINKKDLQNLLEKKRDSIVKVSATEIFINTLGTISLGASLSQIEDRFWSNILLCCLASWLIVAFFLMCKAVKNRYSHDQLFADIVGIGLNEHIFNLMIVQNNQNKVLTVYDERWKMWLFPYKKALTQEEGTEAELLETSKVRDYFSSLIKVDRDKIKCCLKYQEYTNKYSVSDKIQKIYYHRFFEITSENLPDTEEFEISGHKFRWWYINDLEVDEQTKKYNAEIVATVKNKIL